MFTDNAESQLSQSQRFNRFAIRTSRQQQLVSISDKVPIERLEEESMLRGQNVDPNLQASKPEIKICNTILGR
jgi:hypothetical protein